MTPLVTRAGQLLACIDAQLMCAAELDYVSLFINSHIFLHENFNSTLPHSCISLIF